MTVQWALDRMRTEKLLAGLRASDDSLWTEVSKVNGLIEFRGRLTGDIYRVTTDGRLVFHRHADA